MRTEPLLAVVSVSLGTVVGLLEAYIFAIPITYLTQSPPIIYSQEYQAAHWLSLAVSYPVTVLAFYAIGKRKTSPFRAGRSILTIFGGALLGEILGQTVFFFLFPQSNSLVGFPYFYVTAPSNSLGFVFVAFSGFALSNLSLGSINAGTRGKFVLVALASSVFGVSEGFLTGDISLLGRSGFTSQLGIISLLIVTIAVPGRFAVFYLIGRRVPVNGHTLAYFGLLFVGTYIGSVVGATVSITLFGQAYWTLAPGVGTTNMIGGFVLVNTPPSLQVLLEALNPIASLPFLSFFAMSISRTGNTSPGTPLADERLGRDVPSD